MLHFFDFRAVGVASLTLLVVVLLLLVLLCGGVFITAVFIRVAVLTVIQRLAIKFLICSNDLFQCGAQPIILIIIMAECVITEDDWYGQVYSVRTDGRIIRPQSLGYFVPPELLHTGILIQVGPTFPSPPVPVPSSRKVKGGSTYFSRGLKAYFPTRHT